MNEPNPYESPGVTISEQEVVAERANSEVIKPLEPYGVLAFALAVLLLFFPVLADLLGLLVAKQQLALAMFLTLCVYTSVLTPTLVSWRRHRKSPRRWRGYGYLLGALFILGFHAILLVLGLLAFLFS